MHNTEAYKMGIQMANLHRMLKQTHNPEDVAKAMFAKYSKPYNEFIAAYNQEKLSVH